MMFQYRLSPANERPSSVIRCTTTGSCVQPKSARAHERTLTPGCRHSPRTDTEPFYGGNGQHRASALECQLDAEGTA
jgi:hypothetical protein